MHRLLGSNVHLSLPVHAHEASLICAQSSRYLMDNGEAFIAQHAIPHNGIVIDIGANQGQWSSMALSVSTPRIIHACEPLPALQDTLHATFASKPVNIHALAFSDTIGERTFYYFTHKKRASQMSSFYPRPLADAPTPLRVQTTTLDYFSQSHQLATIDFIKIDTEGAELEIIKGATQLLAAQRIRVLQFEYENSFQSAGITLKAVYDLLRAHAYCVFKLLPNALVHIDHWEPSFENFAYGNYIALPQ